MTAEQLEELLDEATPGPWTYEYTGLGHTVRQPGAALSLMVVNHAIAPEADARLIALAPDLARRVIAAEKLAEALKMADSALAGANMDMKAVWRKTQAALAEWDAIT